MAEQQREHTDYAWYRTPRSGERIPEDDRMSTEELSEHISTSDEFKPLFTEATLAWTAETLVKIEDQAEKYGIEDQIAEKLEQTAAKLREKKG